MPGTEQIRHRDLLPESIEKWLPNLYVRSRPQSQIPVHSPTPRLLSSVPSYKQNLDPHVIHAIIFPLSPVRAGHPLERLTCYPIVRVSLILPFMVLIRSKQKEILLIQRNLSWLLMFKRHSLKTTKIEFTSSCLHCVPLLDG